MPLKLSHRSGRLARVVSPRLAVLCTAVAVSVVVAGCGKKEKVATQTAAKVNKEEITVHQINFVLAQQARALPPEAAASASRQVLERLIDQELSVQKAEEKKIDRDPRVVQQIDAARRDIISRAYFDRIGEGAPKPTSAEISAYYDSHRALFADRRIYNFQEVNVEATPAQIDPLKKSLGDSKSLVEFVAYVKANDFRYTLNEAIRGAEQLPIAAVDQFAKMKDGQSMFNLRPGGVQVIYLSASRAQPIDLQHATPAIAKFLLNERKRKLIADDLQALRGASKIEYVGDFAADAARSPYQPPALPEQPTPPPMEAPVASAAVATPQVDVAPSEAAAGSMPSQTTLDQGLKGLK